MYDQQGYRFMGAAFEVYNQVGYGMAEAVYQECLEIELGLRDIPFESKRLRRFAYKEKPLAKCYIKHLFV